MMARVRLRKLSCFLLVHLALFGLARAQTSTTTTTTTTITTTSASSADNDIASPEIIIVNNNNATSLADRNRTFYEVDELSNVSNTTNVSSSTPRDIFTTTVPYVSTRRNEGGNRTTNNPTTPRPTTSSASEETVNIITASRARTTTTTPKPKPSSTTTTTTTTTARPIVISEPSSTTSTTTESPFAELRLRSNLVTLKPTEVVGFHSSVSNFDKARQEPPPGAAELEVENQIWKMILHGTNMNQEELKLCNKTLIEAHFRPYSRRRVARHLKKELDKAFAPYGYRYSVLISATSKNTMGKALHGVWLSMSLNGVHYFLAATYKIVAGAKLTEAQVDKVEYWASLHTFGARNMTGYRRYNRIAQKLKADLDREYGNGNVWSVVIVKNRYYIKAKVFEDAPTRVEFSRLNGGHFIVWRGGQDIADAGGRSARVLNTLDTTFDEDGNEERGSEFETSSSSVPDRSTR